MQQALSQDALRAHFEEIYRTHAPRVWRSLRALGVRHADLEDACQEVFLVVFRKLGDFDGRNPITTWLYAICLRVASAWRRKAHLRREAIGTEIPEEISPHTPHDQLEQQRRAARLAQLLDGLEEDRRTVFVLFELAELPMNEVAETVGVPLKTAYSRLYSARAYIETAVQAARNKEVGT